MVAKACVRANVILKGFVPRDVKTLTRAFEMYARSLLEYANCVWSPMYGNAICQIESVQRKFPKRLPGFEHTD
jgi:hypothetical protein